MILKYKIRCTTENKDKFVYLPKGDPTPTKCPDDSAHAVNLASVVALSFEDAKEVITRTEKTDVRLKIAQGSADVGEGGVASIELLVPVGGRYIDGGVAWFSDPVEGDLVTNIEVVHPVAGVIASYHDQHIAEGNRGWFVPKIQGVISVGRISGWGYVPAGLKLRVKGKRAAATGKMYVNIKWGMDTVADV